MKYSDEINIGDYVRTEAGIFYKILSAANNTFLCIKIRENATKIEVLSDLEPIVKHSKNIIDLIQKDDYVNGYKVLYVCNEEPCPSGKYVDIDCNKPSEESYFFESEIKSIITKEQIKQIEFIIKE